MVLLADPPSITLDNCSRAAAEDKTMAMVLSIFVQPYTLPTYTAARTSSHGMLPYPDPTTGEHHQMQSIPSIPRLIAIRAIICIAILGFAAAVLLLLASTKPKPTPADPSANTRHVSVFAAHPVPVQRQWRGFATVEAMDKANVLTRVSASVHFLPTDIVKGKPVSAGQLIVQLDDSDFIRQVQIATEQLAELDAQLTQVQIDQESLSKRNELDKENVGISQAELNRVEGLFAKGAATQSDYDQAQRNIITAQRALLSTERQLASLGPSRRQLQARRAGQESSVQLAKLNQSRCRIISPLDGVLESVQIEFGENLRIGEQVARVVNLKRMEAALRLPASARPYISVGDHVALTTANHGQFTWVGRADRIAPTDDPATRTTAVYVEIEQDTRNTQILIPGVFVEGTITANTSQKRSVVPRQSIKNDRILIVQDGKITSQRVSIDFLLQQSLPQIGLPHQYWAVLHESLTPGTLVVVVPTQSLLDGQSVKPIISQNAVKTPSK